MGRQRGWSAKSLTVQLLRGTGKKDGLSRLLEKQKVTSLENSKMCNFLTIKILNKGGQEMGEREERRREKKQEHVMGEKGSKISGKHTPR